VRLEVLLFGPLRAWGDGRAIAIDVREGASVGDAREALAAELERLRPGGGARALLQRTVLATDDEVLEDDARLPAGVGRLAALPPVCGG
jgi:molybdopterin converting factor small subunit